jgi:YidC/Oxa1 family membrane protein insertase
MDQQSAGQEQMPGMKLMMYFMPIMLFFWFNSYAAGLNYYYLVSTLISIMQTLAFRFFLNEERLLAKLEANKAKAKPAKKKSGFMARLEEAQRKQQALLKQQQQGRRK